jgi:hypothetical protein
LTWTRFGLAGERRPELKRDEGQERNRRGFFLRGVQLKEMRGGRLPPVESNDNRNDLDRERI